MTRLDRAHRIIRVRQVKDDGTVRSCRYYVQRPAAERRARLWRATGWTVEVDISGPVRFEPLQVQR